MQGLTKTTNILSQNNRSQGWDLNSDFHNAKQGYGPIVCRFEAESSRGLLRSLDFNT
jgi:hypothetical protein